MALAILVLKGIKVHVLLTGGTGFVGRHLVPALLTRGHTIQILSRQPHRYQTLFPEAVRLTAWQPMEQLAPQQAVIDADVVIHLQGETLAQGRWTRSARQRIFDSRVIGTRHLVTAIDTYRTHPLKLFISASAIGYYAKNDPASLGETSPAAHDFLGMVCKEWEREAGQIKKTQRAMVARSGVIWGADGGILSALLPLFKWGCGARIGSGEQWQSWIHIADVVEVLCAALEDPRYQGHINVVAPEPITQRDFTALLAKTLHRPCALTIPAWCLKAALGEAASLILDSQKIAPSKLAALKYPFKFPSAAPALADLCSGA